MKTGSNTDGEGVVMIAQSSVLAMNDARNEAAISAKSSAMSSDLLDFAEWRAFLCAPELRSNGGRQAGEGQCEVEGHTKGYSHPQPRP